ncbi:MAG: protein phosphatase CheZ [Betaproteobacteria bacterium]|nr:protein phosphatase CheZ [Betaproteobacteria bacterium]
MTQTSIETEEDLEALFDQIAAKRAQAADAPVRPCTVHASAAAAPAGEARAADVFKHLGSLTRKLHDALRELGYDQKIEQALHSLPDAQARLSYIATLTGKAAERSLTAVEQAQAVQDGVGSDAARLGARWAQVFANQLGADEFRSLAAETRAFLGKLPDAVAITNAQLHEIMMAQDFHDLTGQTIQRVAKLAQDLEQQLIALLLESTPPERRTQLKDEWLSGPAMDTKPGDVVADQGQVDQLLASLGF